MDRRLVAVILAALAVLAPLAAGVVTVDATAHESGGASTADGPLTQVAGNGTDRPAPPTDRLGWENGYWYDEPIDVNQSDGLTSAETEAYVGRAMARVEVLRGLEFRTDVNLTVVSVENYSEPLPGSRQFWRWENLAWEALFVTGEDENVSTAYGEATLNGTAAFYNGSNEIVVVSDDPDRLVVDNVTLVHELVHVLQNEYYNRSTPRFFPATRDENYATYALVEGDATFIEERYTRRCRGTWDCVTTPRVPPTGFGPDHEPALEGLIIFMYDDGAQFVDSVVQRGGWDAVDRLYAHPPNTTEQIIHGEPNRTAAPLPFRDAARAGWERFENFGENGTDTWGEAAISVLFLEQAISHNVPVVNASRFFEGDAGPYDFFNYTTPPAAGWGNDRFVPYHRDGQSGYVWQTAWDTPRDAGQFYRAYLTVLRSKSAVRFGPDTWVIPDGGFADAFRVGRNGSNVTVVNAPTVATLDEIRPGTENASANQSNVPALR